MSFNQFPNKQISLYSLEQLCFTISMAALLCLRPRTLRDLSSLISLPHLPFYSPFSTAASKIKDFCVDDTVASLPSASASPPAQAPTPTSPPFSPNNPFKIQSAHHWPGSTSPKRPVDTLTALNNAMSYPVGYLLIAPFRSPNIPN